MAGGLRRTLCKAGFSASGERVAGGGAVGRAQAEAKLAASGCATPSRRSRKAWSFLDAEGGYIPWNRSYAEI